MTWYSRQYFPWIVTEYCMDPESIGYVFYIPFLYIFFYQDPQNTETTARKLLAKQFYCCELSSSFFIDLNGFLAATGEDPSPTLSHSG